MVEREITAQEIAAAEAKMEPGRVPEPIWLEHLRLNGVTTIELNPYRIKDGRVQFYMSRRSPKDPIYPNMYHMPGTMVNGNDSSFEEPMERIKQKEMNGFVLGEPEKVANFIRKTPRGTEGVFMFTIQVYDGGQEEDWFDAEKLPEDTIENHKKMVAMSFEAIKAKGQKRQTASFE